MTRSAAGSGRPTTSAADRKYRSPVVPAFRAEADRARFAAAMLDELALAHALGHLRPAAKPKPTPK